MVVAVNHFTADLPEETAAIVEACAALGVKAVRADHWARGGEGAVDLAGEVLALARGPRPSLAFTYPAELGLWEKVRAVARRIYGAADIKGDAKVLKAFADLEAAGFGNLPVCLAKTQYSFSTDPQLRGRPEGFTLAVRDVRVSAGAGFVVVLTGDIMTMPGLPKVPAAELIDIDEDGNITGLS